MISNPKYGWCTFQLGDFLGSPSYLTDVPLELLEAFLNYHENGYGVAVFDEEGPYFTLVLTSYNLGIYLIDEKEEPVLHNFCDFKVEDLERELISDLEGDMNGWANFLTDNDPEEISMHRNEIRQKIARLKKYWKE